MRLKATKKRNSLPKKRGRPSNPDSQRNKLKALHEEYKKARLELEDENEDESDSFMDD